MSAYSIGIFCYSSCESLATARMFRLRVVGVVSLLVRMSIGIRWLRFLAVSDLVKFDDMDILCLNCDRDSE